HLFLSSNPSETTHTYTVNLTKLEDYSVWDTDGDGLSNQNEEDSEIYGCRTEPTNPDSDYDGLSDGEEVLEHLTDPNNPDSDTDGLTDAYEVNTLGTSPLSDDTDEDGLSDPYEVYTSLTDPTNPETDGDGLNDGVDPYPLNAQTQFSWITPASEGATVTGIVTIRVEASDSEGLSSVQYQIDNGNYSDMVPEDPGGSYNYYCADWDSTPFSEGEYTITIRTTDNEGFQTDFTRNVIVYPTFDAIITFISPTPSENSVVSGTITIRVEASDQDGLLDVECQVDGGSFDSMTNYSSYYEINIDTTSYQDGTVWVTVRTTDSLGDQTAIQREFRFFNDPDPATVTFINPTAGATVSGTITIQVEASDLDGLEKVEYKIDGDTYQTIGGQDIFCVNWVTADIETNRAQHTIYIRTTDAFGDQETFTCTVTVDNRAQLSWSNPDAEAYVHHEIIIQVHVSDPNGITSVQYNIDGGSNHGMDHEGGGDYTEPWDTTSYSDGSREIRIIVTDGAGNTRVFTRSVNVVNGVHVGSVTILSPSSGSTVSEVTVPITAEATDLDEIDSVQWRVDGVTGWNSMSYSDGIWHGSWFKLGVSQGWYTLRVQMIDEYGDIVTDSISIYVTSGPI
ncbi:MAG: Ig-like domain-containing protein, partial [Candidatus Hermodarchaeota archaeon]